jgi:hypothetical protein
METQQNVLLPFDYCHRWIRAAFNMAEKHFSLFAILGLIVFVSEVMVSVVPYLGSLANPVLRFIYAFGGLRLMDSLMQKQTHTVESYFKLCFDESLLKPFKNYLLACVGIGLVVEIGLRANIPHFYWLTAITTLGIYLIPFMAYYQFRSRGVGAGVETVDFNITEKQAMDFVLSRAWKNIGNLVCLMIFLMALGFASMALCVVPFFLYFMPLTFPLVYLVYMGLCENKTIEELNLIWNSRGDSTEVR